MQNRLPVEPVLSRLCSFRSHAEPGLTRHPGCCWAPWAPSGAQGRSKVLTEGTGTAQGRPTTPQGHPKGALGTARERPRAPQGRTISIFEKRTALVPQQLFHLPGPPGGARGRPRARLGRSRDPHGAHKDAPGVPQGPPGAPHGPPEGAQGRPRDPQGPRLATQRSPRAPQGRPRGENDAKMI